MAEKKIIGTCPCCGAEVVERQKGWFCANRSCRFILWKDNAFFQKIGKRLFTSIVEHLLLDGHVRLKDCKDKATGKVYNATLHMVTETDGRPVFNLSFENSHIIEENKAKASECIADVLLRKRNKKYRPKPGRCDPRKQIFDPSDPKRQAAPFQAMSKS